MEREKGGKVRDKWEGGNGRRMGIALALMNEAVSYITDTSYSLILWLKSCTAGVHSVQFVHNFVRLA